MNDASAREAEGRVRGILFPRPIAQGWRVVAGAAYVAFEEVA
jgi:hypothetical protein